MAKALVVVESPAKAKTINKYLGRDYKVVASMGHIRDLPKSQIGVEVENDFNPKYITIRGKGSVLKELKDASKKVKKVYICKLFSLLNLFDFFKVLHQHFFVLNI